MLWFQVFPDSEEALQRCSAAGLQLAVVSNFDERLESVLRVCGLRAHFSFLVTSEEAGAAKPSPAIFLRALQRCGSPASSVAHVGDHYVKDYLASRAVGIQGFLLDRDRRGPAGVAPEHRLGSLEELQLKMLG